MKDCREICSHCEHYRPFKGVYECWNRDSDNMYKQTLPDDGCPEFERSEEDAWERKATCSAQ